MAIADKEFVNKSYSLADLKVAFRPIENLELNAKVNNIFNKEYSYSYGFPCEERNCYLGFKYDFRNLKI